MPILLILIMTILSGCSITTPPVTYYTLSPSQGQIAVSSLKCNQSLKIITTETLPSINTKSIRYTLPSHESGYYLYGKWSDTPSAMLNRNLLSTLESTRLLSTLITTSSQLQSDMVLESEFLTFEHQFHTNAPSQGVIDIVCRLIDTKTKHSISAKRFTIRVDATNDTISGGVKALESGMQMLTLQQVEWLNTELK